jgi:hypothetical protein
MSRRTLLPVVIPTAKYRPSECCIVLGRIITGKCDAVGIRAGNKLPVRSVLTRIINKINTTMSKKHKMLVPDGAGSKRVPFAMVFLIRRHDFLYYAAMYKNKVRKKRMPRELRFEPGKDIRPMKKKEFDQAHIYLQSRVNELTSGQLNQRENESNDDHDDRIRDTILRDPKCPEYIMQISKDRPSFYDIFASKHKYRPELVALMEARFSSVGKSESYLDMFMQMVPNSRNVIRDLQKEAMSSGKARPKSVAGGTVNLE